METATDWFMKDLEKRWAEFLVSETARSRAINASVRDIKETLKKKFARAAEDFIHRLQQIEQAIGALAGPLPVSIGFLSVTSVQLNLSYTYSNKNRLFLNYHPPYHPFANSYRQKYQISTIAALKPR